ncbi:hypothetical protein, partial [Neisseria sicca]|uniref:hypothetical protein n=1 Tax=Neisseria sicca TaxID=490 RepID=UPI001C98EA4C
MRKLLEGGDGIVDDVVLVLVRLEGEDGGVLVEGGGVVDLYGEGKIVAWVGSEGKIGERGFGGVERNLENGGRDGGVLLFGSERVLVYR